MRWGPVLRCAALMGFLLVAHGVVAGQAVPGGATVVTEQTHGDVNLKVGAVLEVRLEANHTTGYSWVFAPAVNPVLMRQGRTAYQEHWYRRHGGSGWRGGLAVQGDEGREAGFAV